MRAFRTTVVHCVLRTTVVHCMLRTTGRLCRGLLPAFDLPVIAVVFIYAKRWCGSYADANPCTATDGGVW